MRLLDLIDEAGLKVHAHPLVRLSLISHLSDLLAAEGHSVWVVSPCVTSIRIPLIFAVRDLKGARVRGEDWLAWAHLHIVVIGLVAVLNVVLLPLDAALDRKLLDNSIHIHL